MAKGALSLYYYTERDIYDAVFASKRRFTFDVLWEELASRGCFCPNDTDRHELAELFSLLPHDHYSVERLVEKLQPISKKEKSKYLVIDDVISSDEIKKALAVIRPNMSAAGERLDVRLTGEAAVTAVVDYQYTEINHDRTRLRQKQPRDAVFSFEKDDSGKTVVRYPANEKNERLVKKLWQTISAAREKPVGLKELSLEGVDDPTKRTQFFIELINGMAGFRVADVQKVDVFRKKPSASLSDDEETENIEDAAGFVRRAALDGGGLIYSDEYQRFSAEGFFISKIRWVAEEETPDGWMYVFEAFFFEAESGTDFRYHIRAGYPTKEEGGYALSRKEVSRISAERISRKIELAASNSLQKIASEKTDWQAEDNVVNIGREEDEKAT